MYQDSLQTLKIAQTKFQESAESAEKLEATQEGSEILVPLTGSVCVNNIICKQKKLYFISSLLSQVYVPGKITKPELPLIDIGTGYYAENVSDFLLIMCFLCLQPTDQIFNFSDN